MLEEKMVKIALKNLKKIVFYIDEHVSSARKNLLFTMFEDFKKRMISAPASSKDWYHSAFIGGWIYHTANVIDFSLQLFDLWSDNGAIINFTKEELVIAGLGHDFGKLGDTENEYYIQQTSDWHRTRGMLYEFNKDIQYMKIPDRTLFLFQKYGIELSLNETLGIKLADGLYDEANKAYLISYLEAGRLKTCLPNILHQADMMATTIEQQTKLNRLYEQYEEK